MTISELPNDLRAALNRANAGSLGPMFQAIQLGDVIGTLQASLFNVAPLGKGAAAQYPYTVQAATGTYALPDDAKCMWDTGLIYAYGRKGTATSAVLTVDTAASTAPSAGHCKLSASGDIIFAAADAWTGVDLQYRPQKQDVVELFLPVTTSIATLPASIAAVSLLEAEALTGTVKGKCVIQPIGGAPATTTWANLDVTLTEVLFVVADAVTSCRVKVGVAPKVQLQALLEAAAIFI